LSDTPRLLEIHTESEKCEIIVYLFIKMFVESAIYNNKQLLLIFVSIKSSLKDNHAKNTGYLQIYRVHLVEIN
jgi:hypothetical protein